MQARKELGGLFFPYVQLFRKPVQYFLRKSFIPYLCRMPVFITQELLLRRFKSLQNRQGALQIAISGDTDFFAFIIPNSFFLRTEITLGNIIPTP